MHVDCDNGGSGMFFGMYSCVLLQTGICGVGFSSVLSGQGSASADTTQGQIMLGMGLIVLSQVSARTKTLPVIPKHAYSTCI